ncbi:hypothetical protein ACOXP4_004795 [Escherichia coli O73,17,77:H31]
MSAELHENMQANHAPFSIIQPLLTRIFVEERVSEEVTPELLIVVFSDFRDLVDTAACSGEGPSPFEINGDFCCSITELVQLIVPVFWTLLGPSLVQRNLWKL